MSIFICMITQNQLRKILDYNKETGIFTWKIACQRIRIGDIAGCKNNRGYIQIMINGKLYPAHRLAWLYETGAMPENCIDHINCVRDDNRICNLREATHSQNHYNRGKRKNNISGFKGVHWHKSSKKWRARITYQGKQIYLGYYATPEEASEVYKAKALELHGQFARLQ